MLTIDRRRLLSGTALVLFTASARAGTIAGGMPWAPGAGSPPRPVLPGPWHFFTPAEGRVVEAIVDRIIPPDPDGPGAKDVGCAVFIDRQLAGPFGQAQGLYDAGPFVQGTKEQGPQSRLDPATQYRGALKGIEAHCAEHFGGRSFVDLAAADQDSVVGAIEAGTLPMADIVTKDFWTMLLKNTRQGFFADPVYGGNRDMAAWTWLGFPGARYDYSDWIDRHNEPYPHPPIGIAQAPLWRPAAAR